MNYSELKYLELFNLEKTFETPKGPFTVLKDFTLNIRKGEFVSIIGHSGCGKSTILSMVAGLSEPTHGSVILGDREVDGAGPDRGVVFQAHCLLPWMTAFENVMLGVKQVFPHGSPAQREQIVTYYLHVVGLGHAMHKKPKELSIGMCQRVGIARAFALSPRLLLLDEPFGMLDSLTRCDLQDVLIDLWSKDRKTALLITHDVDEAILLSDRVVMMTNGPNAKVGDILDINLPRPRNRKTVVENPDYYRYREHLIGFLEDQGHHKLAATPRAEQEKKTPLSEIVEKVA